MPRLVVFDTNILFSATAWQGKPYQCLELARAGAIQGLTCKEILDEFSEKLQMKLSFSLQQSSDTLVDLLTFMRLVTITGQLKAVPADPDDDKVLECAVVAGASHVVTDDRRHLLSMGNYRGIEIISAAELLTLESTA